MLQFARQPQRRFNIRLLGRLIAASQKNHPFTSEALEIYAIACCVVDAHLGYAFSHRCAVAKIPIFGAIDPCLYTRLGFPVTQPIEPCIECCRGLDCVHNTYCILWDTACLFVLRSHEVPENSQASPQVRVSRAATSCLKVATILTPCNRSITIRMCSRSNRFLNSPPGFMARRPERPRGGTAFECPAAQGDARQSG